jgi:electron transport complex protein RnfC
MPRVKTFSRGGILVESHRTATAGNPIRPLFLPSLAVVPLVQYPGARAEWVVDTGESVSEDQVLARGLRPEDLPVHSPIPGTILEFRQITLPGNVVTSAALVRLQGEFHRTGRPTAKKEWALISDEELRGRIVVAGIFLESSPLDPRQNLDAVSGPLDALVINALQPEPYLTLSLHLQDERAEDLVEGVRVLQKLLRPAQTHFVGDPDHPEAWARTFGGLLDGVTLHSLAFRYPQAQEGLLLKTIGVVPGEKKRVLTLDAASVLAVRDAVVEGKPQIEKTVIVSGKGVRRPGAYRVRIGTPLVQLLKDAGGLHPGDHRILVGGPFQGLPVENLSVPVLKSTSSVLVLTKDEVNASPVRPCIRCGQCVQGCPVGLEPLNLHKALAVGNHDLARDEGLDLCIECGVCSFLCPSRIPLVTEFHQAKESPHGR